MTQRKPHLSRLLLHLLLCLLCGVCGAGLAGAQPSLRTSYGGFTDVNGNGALDCGEPVSILVAFATNNSGTPALTGTLTAPAAGSAGLLFLPGSVRVEPDLTVGCQAQVARGNSSGDSALEVDFSCPPDPLDNDSWTVVVSYKALYFSGGPRQLTAAAQVATSDGKTYDAAFTQAAGAGPCGTPSRLALTKTASGTGAPGSVLRATLTARDLSGLGNGGLELVETVPSHTRFDATGGSAGWSCSPDGSPGSICRNQVGNIAPGGTLSSVFAVQIDSPLPAGVTAIANTACVSEGPTAVAACASTATPTAGAGVLQLTKTLLSAAPPNAPPGEIARHLRGGRLRAAGGGSASGGGAAAAPGATLVYRLTASNSGNQDLAGVTLTEVVPAATVFAPGASDAGWSCTPSGAAGATCSFSLGALAAGASLARSFALLVDDPLPAGTRQIANTACAHAPAGNQPSGASDACGSVTVPTPAPAAAVLSATLDDAFARNASHDGLARPGDLIVYTLVVASSQAADATTLDLSTPLDPHLTLVPGSVTLSGGPGVSGSVTLGNRPGDPYPVVHLPTLPAGSAVHVTFEAEVAAGLPPDLAVLSTQSTITAAGLAPLLSSDPDNPAPASPTTTPVGHSTTPVAIPTLGSTGLATLGAGLAAAAWRRLRRLRG